MRILIANRGEIARRIIHTARRLGHETVAVYGDPDATAAHVQEADIAFRLGPASLAESYLSPERLLAAIAETEADAVHPGYGFLAENADFARAVIAAGAIWIGPHPDAVAEMGSKIEARRIAVQAGVPIIPGYDASQDADDLAAAADEVGYPVLVKAAAGGGGKGIRIVEQPDGFVAALAEASKEAEHNFGDGAMIVERFITRPRHVEVQVIGDQHGHYLHLGTRECSVQRRYQKVLEEAPAPNLPDATRDGLHAAAVALAEAMAYDSAGTVEFIVDDTTGEFFFLEMNTRLQVEHPVTEQVTGLDLVELMISSANGDRLPIGQDDVTFDGHAFECRINAEDPAKEFAPQIGTITELSVGRDGDTREHGLEATNEVLKWGRFDAAVRQGDEVTPFYDSMIAKLIVWGPDRSVALAELRRWLAGTTITGVVTTLEFHSWLTAQQPVIDGRVTTRFLDETQIPASPALGVAKAAALWRASTPRLLLTGRDRVGEPSPFQTVADFRLTPHRPNHYVILRSTDGEVHEVSSNDVDQHEAFTASDHVDQLDRTVVAYVDDYPHRFDVLDRSDAWAPDDRGGAANSGDITAPFPGVVAEVHVTDGDTVEAGQVCVVIEAMKMLHSLPAPADGTVAAVPVAVGDQVAGGQVLVHFGDAEHGG